MITESRRSFLSRLGAVATVGATSSAGCLGRSNEELPTYHGGSGGSGGSGEGAVPTFHDGATAEIPPMFRSLNFGGNKQIASSYRSINPNEYAAQFANVVNMKQAGADPTGQKDVSPVIEREIDDDTLLFFPQGTYKMNSSIRRVSLRNVGIIGDRAVLKHGRVDAIHGFEVTKGEFKGAAQLFKIGVHDDPHEGSFVFGGFILDWRGENEGMQVLNHSTAGTSLIRSMQALGTHSLGCQGPIRANPATKNAEITISNIDLRFGGLTYQKTINTRTTRSLGGPQGRSLSTTGIVDHPKMRGTLRVKRSLVGGWPDNGIYCVGGSDGYVGKVEVVQCIAANSHPSNIRVGGDGSVIDKCLVVVDRSFGNDFYFNQRPIRLDDGTCTLMNTKIVQKQATGWTITVQQNIQRALLDNLSIAIYEPERGIVVDPGTQTTVQNVDIQTPNWKPSRAEKENLLYGIPLRQNHITINGESSSF